MGGLVKGPPSPAPPPTDPALAAEQQAAKAKQIKELQTEASGDTASIMARYGARLALANSFGGAAAGGTPGGGPPAAVLGIGKG